MAKNILDLGSEEAKEFFLAEERYFTFDLPKYFTFNEILYEISQKLDNQKLSEFYPKYPKNRTVEHLHILLD